MSQDLLSEDSHPNPAVSPEFAPAQQGPAARSELVDPDAIAETEFPPLLDEAAEISDPEGEL